MRLLHTADWHLGKRLDGFARLDEQRAVLNEICELADREAVDAVLVAGDLFDTFNPPTEATELFYTTLRRLTSHGRRPVIAIAGNHDSPDRIEAPDPLARACGIVFVGYPDSQVPAFALDTGLRTLRTAPGMVELQLPGTDAPLRLLLTPYANELRLRTYLGSDDPEAHLRQVLATHWQALADAYCDPDGVNVLMAHLYVMKKDGPPPAEPDDERPIAWVGGAQAVFSENVPPQIQYVALGHLHRCQTIDNYPCPVVYSSSPLAYSFAEADQTKHVVLVDVQPGQPAQVRAVPLTSGRPLRRHRCVSVEEAVDWLRQHQNCLVELTMATDTFLSAPQQRQLRDAHAGIVHLIPAVQLADEGTSNQTAPIDLSRTMEDLFADFFVAKHKLAPNDRLLDLFREALAQEE